MGLEEFEGEPEKLPEMEQDVPEIEELSPENAAFKLHLEKIGEDAKAFAEEIDVLNGEIAVDALEYIDVTPKWERIQEIDKELFKMREDLARDYDIMFGTHWNLAGKANVLPDDAKRAEAFIYNARLDAALVLGKITKKGARMRRKEV